jgi:hypothetical protein
MKKIITSIAISLFLFAGLTSEAQLLNRLKNKVANKISEIEKKKKEDSFGTANIQHSAYDDMSISQLSKTKIIKEENLTRITGSWWTHEADIFDGYSLKIQGEDEVVEGSYPIGELIKFSVAYDPAKMT